MLGTGFLGGLIAKLTGLGSVAKVAIATATAALTMTVAGGATGVLPLPGTHSGPTAVTTEPAATVEGTIAPSTSGESGRQADGAAAATTPAGSTSVTSGVVGSAEAPGVTVPSVTIPPVTVPARVVPDLSGLTQVPTKVLACLTPVLGLVTGAPSVSPGQISQIGTGIVNCVTGVVSDLPLPFGMSSCVSNIMAFVRNIVSQLPTGTPDVGSVDVAACIPAGLPVPTGLSGLPAGLPFMGGGFPFGQ